MDYICRDRSVKRNRVILSKMSFWPQIVTSGKESDSIVCILNIGDYHVDLFVVRW